MKYDYTPQAPYLTLESPASQHPPMWPLLGAILSRLWESQDTFLMLKILSLVAGLCIWLAFLPKQEDFPKLTQLLPFALIAISPWLVDFSTNGSPYILIALILVLADWLWKSYLPNHPFVQIGVGVFCALAILTHNNLTLLPLSFAIKILTQESTPAPKKGLNLAIFFAGLALVLGPYLAWSRHTFGQWFHTPSSYYLLDQLSMASIALHHDQVVWTIEPISIPALLQRYSLLFAKSSWAGLRQFVGMLTPIGFFFFILGLTFIYSERRKNITQKGRASLWCMSFFSPIILYLLTIAFWATYKARFLIPILPISYLLIGKGLEIGLKIAKARAWLLWFGIVALFLWTLFPYRQQPLNFYYASETPPIAQQYDQMKSLASQLAEKPQGVVLGISNSLDGGIETIYWAKQPFVMARDLDEILWIKLAKDFHARYIWSECWQMDTLRQLFPTSQVLLSNHRYCVLMLPP